MDESVRITAEIPAVRLDASRLSRGPDRGTAWPARASEDGASGPHAPAQLRHGVLALCVAALAAFGGLVAVHVRPAWFAVLRNTVAPRRPSAHASTTLATSATSTSTSVVRVAGQPAIYSIAPSSGTSGETVSLVGAGLFSTDGHLIVLFGQTPAVTRCADEQHCSAVVPVLASGAGTVAVRIRTAAGESNSLNFRYR